MNLRAPQKLSAESGQAMLMAIAMGLILIIAVSIVVFINQTGSIHQSARSKSAQSQGVAEQGISIAIQEMSASSAIWGNAINANFPADCNSGNTITTASGNSFRLYCSTGTAGTIPLTDYQVAVTAVALSSPRANDPERPTRALRAILSQRTVGVDLTSDVHAAAALQMVHQPIIGANASLNVHWGPIVCLDSAQDVINTPSLWSLPSPIDAGQYPRKFSVGGITGTNYTRAGLHSGDGPSSDQKEYWAYSSIVPPPVIDEATYLLRAQNETGIAQPTVNGLALAPTGCVSCGYFRTSGGTAVFNNYSLHAGEIIYVDGSAEFDQISIDTASIIVTGALTINDSSGGGHPTLVVPSSAALEYPFNAAAQPCRGQSTCISTDVFPGQNVQYRGFLYVKGNMFVNVVGWTMVGTLVVGDVQAVQGTSGALTIPGPTGPANSSLNLAYEDTINHSILVNGVTQGGSIKVSPDFIEDIPAF